MLTPNDIHELEVRQRLAAEAYPAEYAAAVDQHLQMRLAIFKVAAAIYEGYSEVTRDQGEAYEIAVSEAVALWHETCRQAKKLVPDA